MDFYCDAGCGWMILVSIALALLVVALLIAGLIYFSRGLIRERRIKRTVGTWSRVPAGGLRLRDEPDPARYPIGHVAAGTLVRVVEYRQGMGRIVGQGVEGWIDRSGMRALASTGLPAD